MKLPCEHSTRDYKAIDAFEYEDTTMWVFKCCKCGKTFTSIGDLIVKEY